MKLKDILLNPEIHFLDEDNFVNVQNINHQEVSFDVAYSRPIGTFNGCEIWGSKYFGKKYDLYGILSKERNILAWCAFDIEMHPGYSTLIRAFVDPTARGNNHTLSIINFIVEKLKIKIMIDKDEPTSIDSRKMFKKWYNLTPQERHFNMSFYLNDTKIDNPDVEMILADNSKNNVYIIFEDCYDRKYNLFGCGKRILADAKFY